MKKNNNISNNTETKETGRTIKTKRTVNKTEDVKPKNLGWKEQMKLDFINGNKITPQNEEQQKYLDLLKSKEEKHKSYLTKVSEKAKEKLARIKINADAQYERILEKAIKIEEQLNSFGEKFAKVKEVAAKKLKESAEEKRKKRREAWLNRSIPTPEILEANKKQQEFLAKAHAVKLEEIRTRLDAREKELKEHKVKSEEEKQKQRDKRKEKAMKKALTKLHSHNSGIDLKHTTKEQRIETIKDDKAARKAEYLKMVQLYESEVAANPKAAQERKEKRKRTEAERLAMIAERRKERMERKIVVELSQKKKTQNDIKRFIESEKARLVRKETKRTTYLTKGGIRVPKIKNKVEARPNDIPFEKIPIEKIYYVIARTTDKEPITNKKPNSIFYKVTCNIEEMLLKKHNELLKKEPETYIGIYCYSDKELTNCIMEFVNDKFKDTNSRMEKSLAA